MIWEKLDASLAQAVSDAELSPHSKLLVFVGVKRRPSDDEVESVASLSEARVEDPIFTAEVSIKDVELLSNASWVDHLSLSQATGAFRNSASITRMDL